MARACFTKLFCWYFFGRGFGCGFTVAQKVKMRLLLFVCDRGDRYLSTGVLIPRRANCYLKTVWPVTVLLWWRRRANSSAKSETVVA